LTLASRTILTWVLLLAAAGRGDALAQGAEGHKDWPGAGQLFVGTCYQPVDRSAAQVRTDIALMKRAGFKVVRMGDLSWDYFEPAEGEFTFATFDSIMDEMNAAGTTWRSRERSPASSRESAGRIRCDFRL
jgi:beta-galactosidase